MNDFAATIDQQEGMGPMNPFDDCQVARQPAQPPVNQRPAGGPPPTEKQEKFWGALLVRKMGFTAEEVAERKAGKIAKGEWTKARASKWIDHLLSQPDHVAADAPARSTVKIEDGLYRASDGTVIKVYHTVHGANQQVGQRLKVWQLDDGSWEHEFVYLGKAGVQLATDGVRLTEEEARELGMLYGFCVRCGRTLTRSESQFVGYGKTCAGHEGWWYPTAAEVRELTKNAEAAR